MALDRYNRKRPFLVITRIASPSDGQITSVPNFGEIGKWKVQEHVEVVDRINNKHMTSATVIIDILKGKLTKNRFSDVDSDTVYKTYMKQYNKQIQEGLSTWMLNNKSAIQEKVEIKARQEELEKLKVNVTP